MLIFLSKSINFGKTLSFLAKIENLGKELFNEMLDNYKNSLTRKRHIFSTGSERIANIKENAWKGSHKRKLKMTKTELENLVWKLPKSIIAKIYHISDSTVGKWCRKLGIISPSRGYWSKKHELGLKDDKT